jgi:hypothetical protein
MTELPKTRQDALVLALMLAITAPSDAHSMVVTELAERLSVGMTELEVERCKKRALKELKELKELRMQA